MGTATVEYADRSVADAVTKLHPNLFAAKDPVRQFVLSAMIDHNGQMVGRAEFLDELDRSTLELLCLGDELRWDKVVNECPSLGTNDAGPLSQLLVDLVHDKEGHFRSVDAASDRITDAISVLQQARHAIGQP